MSSPTEQRDAEKHLLKIFIECGKEQCQYNLVSRSIRPDHCVLSIGYFFCHCHSPYEIFTSLLLVQSTCTFHCLADVFARSSCRLTFADKSATFMTSEIYFDAESVPSNGSIVQLAPLTAINERPLRLGLVCMR